MQGPCGPLAVKQRRLASAITVRLIHEHEALCMGLALWHQSEATLHPRDGVGSRCRSLGSQTHWGQKVKRIRNLRVARGYWVRLANPRASSSPGRTPRAPPPTNGGGRPQISDAPALLAASTDASGRVVCGLTRVRGCCLRLFFIALEVRRCGALGGKRAHKTASNARKPTLTNTKSKYHLYLEATYRT